MTLFLGRIHADRNQRNTWRVIACHDVNHTLKSLGTDKRSVRNVCRWVLKHLSSNPARIGGPKLIITVHAGVLTFNVASPSVQPWHRWLQKETHFSFFMNQNLVFRQDRKLLFLLLCPIVLRILFGMFWPSMIIERFPLCKFYNMRGIYRHLYGHRSSITSLGAYVRNMIPQCKYTVYYAHSSHVAIFWIFGGGSVAVGSPIFFWINSLAFSASEANLSLSGSEATLENPDILSTGR